MKDKDTKKDEVIINKQARCQLVWWLLNLRALSLEGAFIPDPDGYFPRSSVLLYPDAAGGATSDCKKGWGCCYQEKKEYARGSWPVYILKNSVLNGQTWGRRLSILEGYGGAQTIPVWVEDIVAAGAVGIMVDNSRFVWAQAKGCGRDEFIYTLAKYIEVGTWK